MTNRESRSPALDGVRGIAILFVLLWHLYACVPHPQWMKYSGPFDWLANIGWSGVDLFFVLSGFLIARILLLHRKQERYFSTFYIRRTARIMPLYYLCLSSFLLVRFFLPPTTHPALAPLLNNHSIDLWSYALFIQNYAMAQVSHFGGAWLGITWSLAVEEQFYLVLPLLVAIAPPSAFRRIVLLLIILAPILRFVSLMTSNAGVFSTYVLLPTRIDGFALGVLGALASEYSAPLLRTRIRLLSLLSVLLFLLFQVVYPHTSGLFQTALVALNHTRFALVYVCLILWVVAIPDGWIARMFGARPLVWIGGTSYFLYLFHQTVQYLVHWAVRADVPDLNSVLGVAASLLAIAILFGLAELSRRFFEQPLIALGHRFKYGGKAPAMKPDVPAAPGMTDKASL